VSDALIGLDVGAIGVKAIAVSDTGEVLARAERGYPTRTPRPGWSSIHRISTADHKHVDRIPVIAGVDANTPLS
jgi:ribulose kinase